MARLTEAQARALGKLTPKWQTGAQLGEFLFVLHALVEKGCADMKFDYYAVKWRRKT